VNKVHTAINFMCVFQYSILVSFLSGPVVGGAGLIVVLCKTCCCVYMNSRELARDFIGSHWSNWLNVSPGSNDSLYCMYQNKI